MAGKKRSKKTTLENFRSWLEGVEEMQGDDWVPTSEQWKKIRNKIDLIEAVKEEITEVPPTYARIPTHAPAPVQSQGSSLDYIAAPVAPVEMSPNAPMAKGQHQVKTPDIDTSKGDYKSAYE